MTPRVCVYRDCSEVNTPDAVICSVCGRRLVPQPRTLDRVRAAIRYTSVDVDPDEHAAGVVRLIEERRNTRDAA